MRWAKRQWALAMLGLSMLPACESIFGIDEPTLREQPQLAAEVAKKLAAARCGALEQCLGHLYTSLVAEKYNAGFRDEPCEQVMEDALLARDLAGLDESIAAGRVTYDPSLIETCADEIVAQGFGLDLVERPDTCKLALAGKRKIGDDCRSSAECEDEAFCDTSSICPGVCKARRSAGEDCADPVVLLPKTARECAVGLMCDGGKCLSVPRDGEPCTLVADTPICRTGSLCLNQACVSALSVSTGIGGAECFGFLGPLCAQGLGCEFSKIFASGNCRGLYDPGGQCCSSLPEQCPSGSRCGGASCEEGVSGVCTPLPGVGEPCVANVCKPFLRCILGVCEKLAEVGEECSGNAVCYSGRCEDDKCSPPCVD